MHSSLYTNIGIFTIRYLWVIQCWCVRKNYFISFLSNEFFLYFKILSILQGIQKNDVMSQIIEKQNIIGNQAQIFIFASDCIYGTYDLPIPSLAYMDVILSIFYSLLIMTIGLLFSFINLSGSKRPYYRRFIVLYSYWT